MNYILILGLISRHSHTAMNLAFKVVGTGFGDAIQSMIK